MHPALEHLTHRPWPLPRGRWQWRQAWFDLAFIHYPVAPDLVAPFIPRGLTLQTCDGSAWLGIVPFRMSGISRRGFPRMLTLPDFPELNVRTYVMSPDGKPGVWFFSLDTTNRTLIFGGRYLYGLPYFLADMHLSQDRAGFLMESKRRTGTAGFRGRYQPTGDSFYAKAGSLVHWLTERYCLYSQHRGSLYRVEVHHPPWPLFEAEVQANDLLAAAGFSAIATRPLVHFSPGVQVISYGRERL